MRSRVTSSSTAPMITRPSTSSVLPKKRTAGRSRYAEQHDQCAEHGTNHGALAAHEGCAADDAGCDCVGIVRLDCVNAVADTGTTDGNDTSQSCHETGQGVARKVSTLAELITGQTSCFRVAAYTVDGTAQSGLGQQDVHDNVDDKYYDKGYREAGYGQEPSHITASLPEKDTI